VKSLFPSNLSSAEAYTLSYVFSRFVLEDTPKDIDWPLVPEGLDALSAALFTINNISTLIGEENPWLLPLWSMKVEELRLEGLQTIHDSLLADYDVDVVIDEMESAKDSIKEILIQNPTIDKSLAPQDPLSNIIDGWLRTVISVRDLSRKEINETRQKLASEILEEIMVRKGAGSVSLEEADLQRMTLTQWNIHALRPDGPSASEHEPMLKMFRGNLNILDHEPVVKICEHLSVSERAGRPSASELEQVTGTKRRMSHYNLQKMGAVLTERFIPTVSKMGLKYRFIFSKKQKPGVLSDGLVERMILSESNYEGCTVHLEPEDSAGPGDELPLDTVELTVDSELLSLRMDLYDKK
jgi:hypothetical protein